MTALMIGYARVSTSTQDLSAQRLALGQLGVVPERVYVDHGLTGTNRDLLAYGKPWPLAVTGTSWSSPSWTAWLGRCLMLGTLLRS